MCKAVRNIFKMEIMWFLKHLLYLWLLKNMVPEAIHKDYSIF